MSDWVVESHRTLIHIFDQLRLVDIDASSPLGQSYPFLRTHLTTLISILPDGLEFKGQLQRIIENIEDSTPVESFKQRCIRAQMELAIDLQKRVDYSENASWCIKCLARNTNIVNVYRVQHDNFIQDSINKYLVGEASIRGRGSNWTINNSILNIPDLCFTYLEMLRYPRKRDAILSMAKGRRPREDESIFRVISENVYTYIKRCSKCEVWNNVGNSLKNTLDSWFRLGGWLEVYVGQMLSNAGSSMYLYNLELEILESRGFRLTLFSPSRCESVLN